MKSALPHYLSAALLTLLLHCTASDAGAADLFCVDKSGKLTVRTACKKGERSISLGAPGPQGPVGPQGTAGPVGPGGLSLYDSTGKRVGAVSDIRSFAEADVVIELDSRLYLVTFTPNDTKETGPMFYISTDCTGPPYNTNDYPSWRFAHPPTISGADRTFYAVDATLPSVPYHAIRSVHYPVDGCQSVPPTDGPLNYPLVPIADLQSIGTPPYSIR